MKYLRSLMQQSVTACKNQAKLIQQFTLSLLYMGHRTKRILRIERKEYQTY